MRIFKCTSKMTLEIVDLPRGNWSYSPPRKVEVALTLIGIVATAILWAIG